MKQLFKEYFRQIFLVFPLILVITALLISYFSPAEAAIPVSYTHLDVYKRQALDVVMKSVIKTVITIKEA